MSSSLSFSTRSSQLGRTNSQLTRNSQDTDTDIPNDYLGKNLLAGAFNDKPYHGSFSSPRHVLVKNEGPALSGLGQTEETTASHVGLTDNTRMIVAIDYGTTFTGKMLR